MPVILHQRRSPAFSSPSGNGHGPVRTGLPASRDCLTIALVNNMPDTALKNTESQFSDLLHAASGDIPVCLRFFSLPKVPRSERAQRYLREHYFDFGDLLTGSVDAAIITGTEPRQPSLEEESYWNHLVELLDWAESHTTSTILSCLAAHAGVLSSDGIRRRPLENKCLGVFEHLRVSSHPLLSQAGDSLLFPHSRWNDLPEQALTSAGYTILLRSSVAGVNLFVKNRRSSLFVYFQGHPEYVAETLFKEYRRDLRRFLTGERESYPLAPEGYFSPADVQLLHEFRARALADRRIEILDSFPEARLLAGLEHSWRSSAIRIYRNWLEYLSRHRADSSARNSVVHVGQA